MHGKQRLKRCVLRRLRKTARDGADVTWCGKPFQTRAAANGKARSPMVDGGQSAIVTRRIVDDIESHSPRSSWARYEGATPC